MTAALASIEGPIATIGDLTRLHGGASLQTWAYNAVVEGVPHPRILRRRLASDAGVFETSIPLATEAALLRIAHPVGVPVPQVVHVANDTDGLGEAYVMTRISGETNGRRIVADAAFAPAREKLGTQCGAALARIHALPMADMPELDHLDAVATLDRYVRIYREQDADRPIFEAAIRWLERQCPTPVAPTLVHSDFRTGNLLVDPEGGLTGVLDWELAHIGDPAEDIGWLCVNSWRFGMVDQRVGGFALLETLLDGYRGAGGSALDSARIDWWQAMGSFKWGVIAMLMYRSFAIGATRSVERAIIGRRVSETEADLLAIMERAR